MFGLSKKRNWRTSVSYFLYKDTLYKTEIVGYMFEKDLSLPFKKLLDKYCKVTVYVYDIFNDCFDEFGKKEYFNISNIPFDINRSKQICEDDLQIYIQYVKSNYRYTKKFNEFSLDETLYTNNSGHYDYGQCFPIIAKVKKKLVYEDNNKTNRILEIEILDGINGKTRREFITFEDFINNYSPECAIKVVDSTLPYDFEIKDYFEMEYFSLPDDEKIPF